MTKSTTVKTTRPVKEDELDATISGMPFSGSQKVKGMKRRVLRGLLETHTIAGALRWAGVVRKSGKSAGEPQTAWWCFWTDPKYSPEGKADKYDPVFVQAVELVQDALRDKVRAEIIRRGITGWDEPVFGNVNGVTQQVGVIRKYDSRLLQWLGDHVLPEGRLPNRADNAINIYNNTNVDARQQTMNVNVGELMDGMSPVEKRLLAQLVKTQKLTNELAKEHFEKPYAELDSGQRAEIDRLSFDTAHDGVVNEAELDLAKLPSKLPQGYTLTAKGKKSLLTLVARFLTTEDLADYLPKLIEHKPALIKYQPP